MHDWVFIETTGETETERGLVEGANAIVSTSREVSKNSAPHDVFFLVQKSFDENDEHKEPLRTLLIKLRSNESGRTRYIYPAKRSTDLDSKILDQMESNVPYVDRSYLVLIDLSLMCPETHPGKIYQSLQRIHTRPRAVMILLDDRRNDAVYDLSLQKFPWDFVYCRESIGDVAAFQRILNPDPRRPSWDSYFMSVAELVAHRTNCIKRGVGAVVVKDRRILSTGYNGTPFNHRNCGDGGCQRCRDPGVAQGHHLDSCLCIHAEVNALAEVSRREANGCSLFVTLHPCLNCAKLICQYGVKLVVFSNHYSQELSLVSDLLFKECGVEVVHWNPTLCVALPAEG